MSSLFLKRQDYWYYYAESEPLNLTMHYHNYYEIIYIVKGDLSYIVKDTSYKVSRGDIFITEPGELHTMSFSSNEIYERHFVQVPMQWLFTMEYDFSRSLSMKKQGQNNQIPAELVKKYHLGEIFEHIKYYAENNLSESDIMIKSLIIQLLIAIITIYKNEMQMLEQPRTSKAITEIKNYISEHFLEMLTLDDIAAQFYVNKYYLCHAFKREMGLTIKEYINTLRIAEAKKLISRHKTTNQLYLECGFNNYSTFYKTFKRFTGVPPTEFFK